MAEELPLGKLKPQLLRRLIEKYRIEDPRVRVGPGIGEDAAAIDLGDRYLLLAADPITFTPERIGWYAVHVNANDIAAMGGEPQYFLSTVLLPEHGAESEMAEQIFSDVTSACREVGCVRSPMAWTGPWWRAPWWERRHGIAWSLLPTPRSETC
jgi:hydrogenase maturation factor